MSDEGELLALEQRRCAAIGAGDIATLEGLLSADYIHVHMTAAVEYRAGHLQAIAKRPRTTTRGEIRVRVYGDLAVLTGELTNHMAVPGQEPRAPDGEAAALRGGASRRAYCHQVAIRADGAWRFASIQLTPLAAS